MGLRCGLQEPNSCFHHAMLACRMRQRGPWSPCSSQAVTWAVCRSRILRASGREHQQALLPSRRCVWPSRPLQPSMRCLYSISTVQETSALSLMSQFDAALCVKPFLRHPYDCSELLCFYVSAAGQSAVLCYAEGLLSRTCLRQRGHVGVCMQVSAALKAQLHPSAEMQNALQLQDAAFDSLNDGAQPEACRTGSASGPGTLHARMHDAFR